MKKLNIQTFLKSVKTQQACYFFFDYDGTLSSFKKNRDEAFPYPGICERLALLLKQPKVRVIIISGRSLFDLKKMLFSLKPLPELFGSHGLEHRTTRGKYTKLLISKKSRYGIEKVKKLCIENFSEDICEIKPFAVAVHFRGRSVAVRRKIEAFFKNKLYPLCEKYSLRFSPFDGGIEIKPQAANKGIAVQNIIKKLPKNIPIAYFGDDLTDEDAFKALGNRGLKVLVRKKARKSLADVRIKTIDELLVFLDQCIIDFN